MINASRGSSSLSAALDLLWVAQQRHPQEEWQPLRRAQASQRRSFCPDRTSAATCDQLAHTCLSILVGEMEWGARYRSTEQPCLPVERKNQSKNWFTTAATQPSFVSTQGPSLCLLNWKSYRQNASAQVIKLGFPEGCEP